MIASDILGLLIAALGGSAVGVERQWSGHGNGPDARFAGIRTFTMLGAVAGLCGWLWKTGLTTPAAILFGGAVTITAVAYIAASRRDVDATTEVAALIVLAAGLLAGIGTFRLASAIIALETLVLVEKSRLHALVERVDDVDFEPACALRSWRVSSCRCSRRDPTVRSEAFALASCGRWCSSFPR